MERDFWDGLVRFPAFVSSLSRHLEVDESIEKAHSSPAKASLMDARMDEQGYKVKQERN